MLNQISEQQANKVVAINENFEAVLSAGLFGIDRSLSIGLLFAWYGGVIWNGSAFATIADGTIALSGSATNYIEADSAGVVYKNTTGFTAGRTPLYVLVTSSTGITTVTDYRIANPAFAGGNGNFRFVTIGSGTLTDSAPALTITQTWNDAADVFVAVDMNITDTASQAASILQRWRVGGSAVATLLKTGALTLAAGLTAASLSITGAAAFNGDTTIGDASGDTLTINAGTWTIGANYTATRAAGTVAAGVVNLSSYSYTLTGDSGGTTDARAMRITPTLGGANAVTALYSVLNAPTHNGTATLTAFRGHSAFLTVSNTGNATTAQGFTSQFNLSSSGSITTGALYDTLVPVFSSTGTIATLYGLRVVNLGNSLVTTATGVKIDDFTSATNMRGIHSSISSGSGKYNLYLDGTAANYLLGDVGIGALPQSNTALYVAKTMADTGSGERALNLVTVANNATGSNTKAGLWSLTNFGASFAGTSMVPAVWAQNQASNAATFGGTPIGYLYDLTISAAAVITDAKGIQINTATNTTGTLTNFTAIDILAQTVGTNIYGLRARIASASNRWNIHADGTAQNYLAGVTGIGIAASGTAALALAASTTGVASLRIPHGSAPSSPVNGDVWTTTAGLYVRINGATVGPLT